MRDDATRYAVADGALTVTTVPGEIYRAGTGGGTLLLQSADHAGADFVLETTLSGTITTGYSQAGIMVHADDDNYVKFNAISDDGANRINRVELRSEVAGVVPDGGPEFGVPAGNDQDRPAADEGRDRLHAARCRSTAAPGRRCRRA